MAILIGAHCICLYCKERWYPDHPCTYQPEDCPYPLPGYYPSGLVHPLARNALATTMAYWLAFSEVEAPLEDNPPGPILDQTQPDSPIPA